MIPILHLSALHGGHDSRVVYREGFSLATRYRLTMALTHPDVSVHPGIRFVGVPHFPQLWKRLLLVHPRLFFLALGHPARLVHLHDPELIPLGLLLRLLGRTVILDVHENLHRQLSAKKLNASALYWRFFRVFDRLARRQFHFIFAETAYPVSYPSLRYPSAAVLNYAPLPLLEPFRRQPGQIHDPAQPEFFYIGQLSFARCLDVLIQALARLSANYPTLRVHLFGAPGFDLFDLGELNQIAGYETARNHLIFHGYTDAHRAFPFAARCVAGLALLKPVGDFPDSYPTKLFEYLALGLPVVTSDFSLYRAVVEPDTCGICVDAASPEAVAQALRTLLENPSLAGKLGENGRRAAEKYYAWASQEAILFQFYERLHSRVRRSPELQIQADRVAIGSPLRL
ncbi:MAG: glycosyltransferase [Sphingobacteriaceae bacterium]|nr:glycosyltransferase [Cytophagaceae bacterium]